MISGIAAVISVIVSEILSYSCSAARGYSLNEAFLLAILQSAYPAMPAKPLLSSSANIYSKTTMSAAEAYTSELETHPRSSAIHFTARRHSPTVTTVTAMPTQPLTIATSQNHVVALAVPTCTEDMVVEVKTKCCDEQPEDDYGQVDPKSGLNDCEIAGIVIGCILIFVLLVYLGLKLLVLREAKSHLDWERNMRHVADWVYGSDWDITRQSRRVPTYQDRYDRSDAHRHGRHRRGH